MGDSEQEKQSNEPLPSSPPPGPPEVTEAEEPPVGPPEIITEAEEPPPGPPETITKGL